MPEKYEVYGNNTKPPFEGRIVVLKKYQPARTDFLINNDWGIPSDQLSKEAAKSRGLKLFHKRWVTKEEKRQLKEEYVTYHSVTIVAYLLIFLPLLILINIREILGYGTIYTLGTVIYGSAMLVSGLGLMRFNPLARKGAIFLFLSWLLLPFTPLFIDDKGAPLFIFLGLSGLYYLLRKTARKIFSPPAELIAVGSTNKSSLIRKGMYLILLLLVLSVAYFVYDMSQARQMAANACNRATQGVLLEDYLSKLSENDYRIIYRDDQLTIVPKRGIGRNNCLVRHDGEKIIGSKVGSND